MVKKTVLIALLFLCFFPREVFANSSPHSGFFIGHNLGYSHFDSTLTHDFSESDGSVYKNDIGSHSPNLGFFFGYGWSPNIDGIYIGPEIFAQYENIEVKNRVSDIETDIRANSSYGATLKIGYVYKGALFFLKSGVVSMGDMKKGLTTRKKGVLIGLGIDYAFNNKWSLGSELDYESYSKIEGSFPQYVTISYQPRKFVSNLRLKYSF